MKYVVVSRMGVGLSHHDDPDAATEQAKFFYAATHLPYRVIREPR